MSLLSNIKQRVSGLLSLPATEVNEPGPPETSEARSDKPARDVEEEARESQQDNPVIPDTISDSIVPEEPIPSNIRDDVFIQSRRSFKKTTNEALKLSTIIGEVPHDKDIRYYISVYAAMKLQHIFHKVVIILLGILAGLTGFHTVIAFFIINDDKTVKSYQAIGAYVQAICYACFALFVIRCLDMSESGTNMIETFKKMVSMQKDLLVLLIAMAGFICSMLMTRYEEEGILNQDKSLIIWRGLSAGRAVAALIGWFMIGLRPGSDCTQARLIEITKTYEERQEKIMESSHERALSSLANSHFDLSQDFDNSTLVV